MNAGALIVGEVETTGGEENDQGAFGAGGGVAVFRSLSENTDSDVDGAGIGSGSGSRRRGLGIRLPMIGPAAKTAGNSEICTRDVLAIEQAEVLKIASREASARLIVAVVRSARRAACTVATTLALGVLDGLSPGLLERNGDDANGSSTSTVRCRADLVGVNGSVACTRSDLSRRLSSSISFVFSSTAPLMLRTVRLTASSEGALNPEQPRRLFMTLSLTNAICSSICSTRVLAASTLMRSCFWFSTCSGPSCRTRTIFAKIGSERARTNRAASSRFVSALSIRLCSSATCRF